MSQIQCQVLIPESKERENNIPNGITVGDAFELLCEDPGVDIKTTELRVDEADQYKLRLMDIQKENQSLKLKVVSYQTGEHVLKAVQIVDAEKAYLVPEFKFQVQSVIQKNENEKPEPFGPRGPFELSLPWWYYGFWVFVFLLIAGTVYVFLKRRVEKQKLLAELDQFGTTQSPYIQFHQSLRKIVRELDQYYQSEGKLNIDQKEALLKQLDHSYRLYIGRTFQVPSFHWSQRLILKEIKQNHRRSEETYLPHIRKNLTELEKALSADRQKISYQDIQQLITMIRKNIDKVNISLKQEGVLS